MAHSVNFFLYHPRFMSFVFFIFRAIFSTTAFWALIIAHCGQNWGFYTLLTEIPTYLKNIQHFSLTGNGFISALPYLCMSILCIPFSILADWLISTQRLSLGATR